MGEWSIYPIPSSAAPAYDNWENSAYLFSSTLCIKKVISDVNVHFLKFAEKYFVTKCSFQNCTIFSYSRLLCFYLRWQSLQVIQEVSKRFNAFSTAATAWTTKKRTPFRLFCIAELILCLWVKNINKQTYEFWK